MGTKDPNYYAGTHLQGRGDPVAFVRLHWGDAGLDAEQEFSPEDAEALRAAALRSDDEFEHKLAGCAKKIYRAVSRCRVSIRHESNEVRGTRPDPVTCLRRAVVSASGGWGEHD